MARDHKAGDAATMTIKPIVWGKAGKGTWQKVGDACQCSPADDRCDHAHDLPTDVERTEQSLDAAECSVCSATVAELSSYIGRCDLNEVVCTRS